MKIRVGVPRYIARHTVCRIRGRASYTEVFIIWTDCNNSDEMITTDEVIKELFEIADKKVPEQVVDRDEIRGELDELNEGKFDFSISSSFDDQGLILKIILKIIIQRQK